MQAGLPKLPHLWQHVQITSPLPPLHLLAVLLFYIRLVRTVDLQNDTQCHNSMRCYNCISVCCMVGFA